MCGRYELHTHPAAIALAFGLTAVPELRPRYNIAPLTDVPVVRVSSHGERELVTLRWGMVPRWARDPSIGSKIINARAETLAVRHSFRMPYRRHRCLLPCNGFYEWMVVAGTPQKQPVHIGRQDGGLFALGGLYERWLSPEGEVLDTCTIVTTAANTLLARVHERMPLVIAPEDYARWLDPATDEVPDLLRPASADAMTYYPVSTRVNAARNDGPSLIAPEAPMAVEEQPAAARVPEQESLF